MTRRPPCAAAVEALRPRVDAAHHPGTGAALPFAAGRHARSVLRGQRIPDAGAEELLRADGAWAARSFTSVRTSNGTAVPSFLTGAPDPARRFGISPISTR
jgi:hypothetical protein